MMKMLYTMSTCDKIRAHTHDVYVQCKEHCSGVGTRSDFIDYTMGPGAIV